MKLLFLFLLTGYTLCAQDQAIFYFQADSANSVLTKSQITRIEKIPAEHVTVYSDSLNMQQRVDAVKSATGIEPKRVYCTENKISILFFSQPK